MTAPPFQRQPLLPEEADRLANACESQIEKLIIWVLLDTGLRISELVSLTSSSLLWQQQALEIYGKGGPYGTKSKRRVVPLSYRSRLLLESQFTLQDQFPLQARQCQRIVKQVANRAKLSKYVCPHVLRHTFATLALQKGISIAAVQKMLGHDHITTTQVYLNLTPMHLIEEFQRKW